MVCRCGLNTVDCAACHAAPSGSEAPKAHDLPVKFPVSREFGPESASLETATTTNHAHNHLSAIVLHFRYWGFARARSEPWRMLCGDVEGTLQRDSRRSQNAFVEGFGEERDAVRHATRRIELWQR